MATSAPFEDPMAPSPDGGAPADADDTRTLRTSKSQWVCHSLSVQIGDEPEKDVHVYYPKNGGGVPLFDLVRVAMVLCCVEKTTAQPAVSYFFKTRSDLELQDTVSIGTGRCGTYSIVEKLIDELNCGRLCTRWYNGRPPPSSMSGGRNATADIILARQNFLKSKLKEFIAHQCVEILPTDTAASSNHTSDSFLSESMMLVQFWKDVDPSQKAEYEGAIERFFAHPHVAATYGRMEACEHDWKTEELNIMCDTRTEAATPIGYVYAARNALFGHLLKIGATMFTPEKRLRELSSTGVPEPFELVAFIQSTNPFALEKAIHRHFGKVRTYGRRKEFFTLTCDELIVYFKSLGGHAASSSAASKKRKTPAQSTSSTEDEA